MPWQEKTKVQERLIFIAKYEDGESMASLCREFGISRKTGYKFLNRYREDGPKGLDDLRRRPYTNPNKIKQMVVDLIVSLKQDKPHWGSAKIRELLERRHPDIHVPARSTVHLILEQYGLVKKRRSRRLFLKAHPTDLQPGTSPNDLWCIDFKGQFKTVDERYCYPLTISDYYSRFLLGCEALDSTKSEPAFRVFEEIFNEYGLPNRIRSDNGAPFASTGLLGLTKLSVWFLRLGIGLERIEPGKPQQNGRHERMHRTLKKEATKPPEKNIYKQQERFDAFRKEYNYERPHEALDMNLPSEIYAPSQSKMPSMIEKLEYPEHDATARVTNEGMVRLKTKKGVQRFYVCSPLYGETIGFKEREDRLWEINFMDYFLGIYDEETNQFTPLA
jgi:transposase InsO family protein